MDNSCNSGTGSCYSFDTDCCGNGPFLFHTTNSHYYIIHILSHILLLSSYRSMNLLNNSKAIPVCVNFINVIQIK